jgi:hypothetical protein
MTAALAGINKNKTFDITSRWKKGKRPLRAVLKGGEVSGK